MTALRVGTFLFLAALSAGLAYGVAAGVAAAFRSVAAALGVA